MTCMHGEGDFTLSCQEQISSAEVTLGFDTLSPGPWVGTALRLPICQFWLCILFIVGQSFIFLSFSPWISHVFLFAILLVIFWTLLLKNSFIFSFYFCYLSLFIKVLIFEKYFYHFYLIFQMASCFRLHYTLLLSIFSFLSFCFATHLLSPPWITILNDFKSVAH